MGVHCNIGEFCCRRKRSPGQINMKDLQTLAQTHLKNQNVIKTNRQGEIVLDASNLEISDQFNQKIHVKPNPSQGQDKPIDQEKDESSRSPEQHREEFQPVKNSSSDISAPRSQVPTGPAGFPYLPKDTVNPGYIPTQSAGRVSLSSLERVHAQGSPRGEIHPQFYNSRNQYAHIKPTPRPGESQLSDLRTQIPALNNPDYSFTRQSIQQEKSVGHEIPIVRHETPIVRQEIPTSPAGPVYTRPGEIRSRGTLSLQDLGIPSGTMTLLSTQSKAISLGFQVKSCLMNFKPNSISNEKQWKGSFLACEH